MLGLQSHHRGPVTTIWRACLLLCPLTAIFWGVGNCAVPSKGKLGLYGIHHPNVIYLDAANFKSKVYSSADRTEAWYIEFYAHWCGHCQNFAPTWEELAKDLKGWQPRVYVAALDCGNESNTDVCREQSITGFPTIKWFPPQAKPGAPGILFPKKTPRDTAHLRYFALDQLEAAKNAPKAADPKAFINYFFTHKSLPPHRVVLVFEGDDTDLARELNEDMFNERHEVRLVGVGKDNEVMAADYRVDSRPQLIILNKDGKRKSITLSKPFGHLQVQQQLRHHLFPEEKGAQGPEKDVLGIIPGVDVAAQAKVLPESGKADMTLPAASYSRVHHQDILMTISLLLRSEVALHLLKGIHLHTIVQFLEAIVRYIHLSHDANEAIKILVKGLKHQKTITTRQWHRLMAGWHLPGTPDGDEVVWVQCKGSEPKYRG